MGLTISVVMYRFRSKNLPVDSASDRSAIVPDFNLYELTLQCVDDSGKLAIFHAGCTGK